MGTHIDVFFPRSIDRSISAILAKLSEIFDRLDDDLELIRELGQWYSRGYGNWWLVENESDFTGEGPCGFSINVYQQVIEFTSLQRFSALTFRDNGIKEVLRRIFDAVTSSLGPGG